MNILNITSCKIAFCKTEVINGIKQVSLADAIFSANTNNAFSKIK